ncbi:MAG TPA: SDR family NAD(P)-dependent oxidoreductase [Gemmatimonadales bacterium]|nr:SDR family NAD(P)-dependent oxidoreductase [Gemmatimonadales bacterium]
MPESTRSIGTALVTGGTRGLGRELVLALAAAGTRTWTVARRRRGIEALSRDAPGVTVFQGDLTSRGTTARIARRFAKDGVSLDLLVHNAGLLGPRVPLAQWSRTDFDAVMAANVSAPFDLTRRLLPRCHTGTVVVFITSGVTTAVRTEWGAYQVSKVAVENLARTFAREFGPAGPRVLIVDPGSMRTAMRAAAYPDEDPMSVRPPAVVAAQLLALVRGGDWTSGERVAVHQERPSGRPLDLEGLPGSEARPDGRA